MSTEIYGNFYFLGLPTIMFPFRFLGSLFVLGVSLLISALVVSGQPLYDPTPGTNIPSTSVAFQWAAGSGRYRIQVGTTGKGSSNIYNGGYLSNTTVSQTISGLPMNEVVYVRLWSEIGTNTDSYSKYDYIYNCDLDADGILNYLDSNPALADPMRIETGKDYAFSILGSGRVASLQSSLFNDTFDGMDGAQMQAITKIVYSHFEDAFDFIIISSNKNVDGGGKFFAVQNKISGIGKGIYDLTSSYGSSGKLQGSIYLTSAGSLSGGPSLHEICHKWGNSLTSVPSEVASHWGYSSVGGQLGGFQPGSLESLGNDIYRAKNPATGKYGIFGGYANGGNGLAYSQFELYLMGLIPVNEVNYDIQIVNGYQSVNPTEGTFSATSITTLTMAEVVNMDGERIPSHLTSQKNFRVLYLVLAATPMTLAQWAAFDEDVYYFDLDGSDGRSVYNFWEATGGRATLTMDGLKDLIRKPPPPLPKISVVKDWVLTNGNVSFSLGTIPLGASGEPIIVTIQNVGNADLSGLSVNVAGANSEDFLITQPSLQILSPFATTAFSVSFRPTGAGYRTGIVSIASNDATNNPFTFILKGDCPTPEPEIALEQPAKTQLASNRSAKAFGTSIVGEARRSLVFTVRNIGNANLTGLKITTTGKHSMDFVLTQPSKTQLTPGSSTTFKVKFKPSSIGTRSATLRIASNDSDENPFKIKLNGVGKVK